jgi:Ca2+-binding EF-hand superfamily protein
MKTKRTLSLRFIKALLGFGAAAAVLSAGGCAGTSPGQASTIDGAFIRAAQTWDLNHDGNVTCDEWKAYALSLFKEVDVNHDGKLTPDEFAKLASIDHLFDTANFQYYDADNKGYVTQADFVDKPNPAFTELDKDHTCVLKHYQLRSATSNEPKKTNPALPGQH